MANLAFCTLTYGEKYTTFGDSLIKQLNDMGYHIFVMTNNPEHYVPNDLLTVIKYDKPYFSFHEKRVVMKECLKHYDTAVFLDADVFISDTDNLDFLSDINPGLHIFATFGNIGHTYCSDDISICEIQGRRNTKYGKEGIDFAENNGFKLKKVYHNGHPEDYLEHYLEGRWIIKKDKGTEENFFKIWDDLSVFTEEFDIRYNYLETIGSGEGSSMSIACYNSGITYNGVSPLSSQINKIFISNYQEKLNGTKPWNIAG
jgi:hypothetical protein